MISVIKNPPTAKFHHYRIETDKIDILQLISTNQSNLLQNLNKGFKRMPKGEMYRYDQTRVGLNSLYCKRYVYSDTITSSNLKL